VVLDNLFTNTWLHACIKNKNKGKLTDDEEWCMEIMEKFWLYKVTSNEQNNNEIEFVCGRKLHERLCKLIPPNDSSSSQSTLIVSFLSILFNSSHNILLE
jgi:hypothetical protein